MFLHTCDSRVAESDYSKEAGGYTDIDLNSELYQRRQQIGRRSKGQRAGAKSQAAIITIHRLQEIFEIRFTFGEHAGRLLAIVFEHRPFTPHAPAAVFPDSI